MENPIKMDDLGGFPPYFWKHRHDSSKNLFVEYMFVHIPEVTSAWKVTLWKLTMGIRKKDDWVAIVMTLGPQNHEQWRF